MAQTTVAHFDGGISPNSKTGLPNSCRFSRNLDIFSDGDSVTLNPIPVKESGSTVTDLVKWMVDATPYDTNRYAYGDAGNIYKITSGNVYSVDRTVSGGAGQGLGVLANYLYYATSTTLGRKGLLSGTPAYNDDFLSDGTADLDRSQTGSGQTYTLPTSIAETATAKFTFAPQYDPVKSIQVNIVAKGTGDWTVTLHDASNNSIATATVLSAALSTGNYTFTFSTPGRVVIGNSYHVHITSTVADGTVGTGTTVDLSTAYYKTFFGILIADTDYHPIAQHTNGVTGTIVIGNEHYLAQWDQGTFNPNKITLEPGFKVRALTKDSEFIVAACWRGNNIDSTEVGRLYYWDGISTYFNYYKEITAGLPNAAANFKNRLFMVAGSSGDLTIGTEPVRQIQSAPQLPTTARVEVLPGAMTVWRRRAHFGYSNCDESTYFEQGVYEFGNQSDRAISYQSVTTEVLNYAYTISTGTTKSTTLKIGCVQAFGKDLYIGWKDASSYGVDKVSKSNNPAATGSWESLIDDDTMDKMGNRLSSPQTDKLAIRLVVAFSPLPTGCTVTPKYRINRATSFTTGTAATAGASRIAIDINMRYREIEYGFDCTATTSYPLITGVYLEFNPLTEERMDS